MIDEIDQKLQVLLATPPIEDECKVVYLLTQTRKVFERDAQLKQHLPTLQFYCNWALHTKLDRSATEFLAKVDPILTLVGNHDQETKDELDRLFTLQTFRDELREFLTRHSIERTLCDNDAYWAVFLSAYSRVVEKCEIAVGQPSPPHGPLNLSVKSVAIDPVKGRNAFDAARPYPMDWTITYIDGRCGRLALSDLGLLGAVLEI